MHNAPLTHFDEYGLFSAPICYTPYQEPREAVHEVGSQVLDAGRFIASAPYHVERGGVIFSAEGKMFTLRDGSKRRVVSSIKQKIGCIGQFLPISLTLTINPIGKDWRS